MTIEGAIWGIKISCAYLEQAKIPLDPFVRRYSRPSTPRQKVGQHETTFQPICTFAFTHFNRQKFGCRKLAQAYKNDTKAVCKSRLQ